MPLRLPVCPSRGGGGGGANEAQGGGRLTRRTGGFDANEARAEPDLRLVKEVKQLGVVKLGVLACALVLCSVWMIDVFLKIKDPTHSLSHPLSQPLRPPLSQTLKASMSSSSKCGQEFLFGPNQSEFKHSTPCFRTFSELGPCLRKGLGGGRDGSKFVASPATKIFCYESFVDWVGWQDVGPPNDPTPQGATKQWTVMDLCVVANICLQ